MVPALLQASIPFMMLPWRARILASAFRDR
jgi:hypothetical protein